MSKSKPRRIVRKSKPQRPTWPTWPTLTPAQREELLCVTDGGHVHTSGGKDSLALLSAVQRLAGQQFEKFSTAVHAILPDVEWPGVTELARRQAEYLGYTFETVQRSQGSLLEHFEQRGKFSDAQNRFCTSDHKTAQCLKVITARDRVLGPATAGSSSSANIDLPAVLGPWADQIGPDTRVYLNILGMRADESPARAKLPELAIDEKWSTALRAIDRGGAQIGTRRRLVLRWLPIHAWTEAEVQKHCDEIGDGDLTHFAYHLNVKAMEEVMAAEGRKAVLQKPQDELRAILRSPGGVRWGGMPRLSCAFCIFAPKPALALAMLYNRDMWGTYRDLEARIDFSWHNRQKWRIGALERDLGSGLIQLGGLTTAGQWNM